MLPQHWLRPENEPHDIWCERCGKWVTKWHKHWTKPGKPVRAK